MSKNSCYECGKEGHWGSNCPTSMFQKLEITLRLSLESKANHNTKKRPSKAMEVEAAMAVEVTVAAVVAAMGKNPLEEEVVSGEEGADSEEAGEAAAVAVEVRTATSAKEPDIGRETARAEVIP